MKEKNFYELLMYLEVRKDVYEYNIHRYNGELFVSIKNGNHSGLITPIDTDDNGYNFKVRFPGSGLVGEIYYERMIDALLSI